MFDKSIGRRAVRFSDGEAMLGSGAAPRFLHDLEARRPEELSQLAIHRQAALVLIASARERKDQGVKGACVPRSAFGCNAGCNPDPDAALK